MQRMLTIDLYDVNAASSLAPSKPVSNSSTATAALKQRADRITSHRTLQNGRKTKHTKSVKSHLNFPQLNTSPLKFPSSVTVSP